MNRHRDLDRLLGDWLEDAPASAPDAVLTTILAAFPSIPQRRGWRIPWRIPIMNGDSRLALMAAAAVVVGFAVGGLLWFGGSSGPSVGGPTPTTPDATVDHGGQDPRTGLVPDVVVGHWVDERDPDGLPSGRYELILEPSAASARRLDDAQPPIMLGNAGGFSWENIHFGPTSMCAESGSYRWVLGEGGSISFGTLVLEAIADSCDVRRSLLEGWWDRMTYAEFGELHPAVGLEGGRHSLTVDGIPFSFKAPAHVANQGWARYLDLLVSKDIGGAQAAEAVVYWTGFPDGEFADPCGLLSLPVGPSIADLATVVSSAPYTEVVEGPSDVTVGARPAKHVVLTVLEDISCDPGFFYTWVYQPGGPGWWSTGAGDTINVWIVDVDGKRLFIASESTEQASAELEQEIQQIVDSIQFE